MIPFDKGVPDTSLPTKEVSKCPTALGEASYFLLDGVRKYSMELTV